MEESTDNLDLVLQIKGAAVRHELHKASAQVHAMYGHVIITEWICVNKFNETILNIGEIPTLPIIIGLHIY
jgi:hypothetical protein